MANEHKTDAKSEEQDKERMPLRDQSGAAGKSGTGKVAKDESAGEAPLDPEDAAFIKKNQ